MVTTASHDDTATQKQKGSILEGRKWHKNCASCTTNVARAAWGQRVHMRQHTMQTGKGKRIKWSQHTNTFRDTGLRQRELSTNAYAPLAVSRPSKPGSVTHNTEGKTLNLADAQRSTSRTSAQAPAAMQSATPSVTHTDDAFETPVTNSTYPCWLKSSPPRSRPCPAPPMPPSVRPPHHVSASRPSPLALPRPVSSGSSPPSPSHHSPP